jgi:O-glycosyl hydrolase
MVDMLIDDLGATIFRLDPYGLSNWETLNDNDDPQSMNWEYYNDRYSIPAFEASWASARYLNARGIRPFLTLSGIAPDWMLDMRPAQPGRKPPAKPDHLRADMYDEFAETVTSMLLYARHRARIDFEYFSPVNETDCPPREGPAVSPREFPAMLGAIERRMRKEGLGDIRLVVADQCGQANDYFGPILAQPELMKQVGVFSLHTYGKQPLAPKVEQVRQSPFPHVPVWLTEYGDLNDIDFSAENEWNNYCLASSERVLRALNEGLAAGLFWDAYDNFHEHDQRMTYYGLVKNTDHIYSPKKRYYAARQLYRFVRPGAQRIAAETDVAGLTLSAFRDGDSVILVGVKRGGPDVFRVAAKAVAAWELFETTRDRDCAKAGTFAAKSGEAEIRIPGEAVFTLVGK